MATHIIEVTGCRKGHIIRFKFSMQAFALLSLNVYPTPTLHLIHTIWFDTLKQRLSFKFGELEVLVGKWLSVVQSSGEIQHCIFSYLRLRYVLMT